MRGRALEEAARRVAAKSRSPALPKPVSAAAAVSASPAVAGAEGEKLQCRYCSSTFQHLKYLRKHELIYHVGARLLLLLLPHSGRRCLDVFLTGAQLIFILDVRAGERNEKCVQCGAAFIYPCLLCVHTCSRLLPSHCTYACAL